MATESWASASDLAVSSKGEKQKDTKETREHATVHWLGFEGGVNYDFTSGGYSIGPSLAYTPQLQGLFRPWFTLVPRLDFQLIKTPGGTAPIFGLGAEAYFKLRERFYLGPGLGAALAAETGSTEVFPYFSATAGYRLPGIRGVLLSKLDRLLVRYVLYLSPVTTHQVTLGIGINLD